MKRGEDFNTVLLLLVQTLQKQLSHECLELFMHKYFPIVKKDHIIEGNKEVIEDTSEEENKKEEEEDEEVEEEEIEEENEDK